MAQMKRMKLNNGSNLHFVLSMHLVREVHNDLLIEPRTGEELLTDLETQIKISLMALLPQPASDETKNDCYASLLRLVHYFPRYRPSAGNDDSVQNSEPN